MQESEKSGADEKGGYGLLAFEVTFCFLNSLRFNDWRKTGE